MICFYSTICTSAGLVLELFIFWFILSPSETTSSINLMIFVQHLFRTLMFASNYWTGFAFLIPGSLEEFFGPSFCSYFVALTGLPKLVCRRRTDTLAQSFDLFIYKLITQRSWLSHKKAPWRFSNLAHQKLMAIFQLDSILLCSEH